jgi:DNA-binding FrmR family transcriptional regulator
MIYPVGVFCAWAYDMPGAVRFLPQPKVYRLWKEEEVCMADNDTCCCSGKHKERSDKEYKNLMNRLKRIEGQIRGIEGMLEKDAYCTDILTQVSAVNAALNSFNKKLLENHIKTCVADNIREGNDEVIDELVGVLQKLMK